MISTEATHDVLPARRQRRGDQGIRVAFLVLLALSLLKGVRMPSRWAVTNYAFNYNLGFQKRGLLGEALFLLLGERSGSYLWLAAIAFFILAVFVAYLVRASWKLRDQADLGPFLIVLGSSPAFLMMAHLVGYLEQAVYLALLLIMSLSRRPGPQAAVLFATAALSPLIHEGSIFWIGALSMLAVLAPGPVDAEKHRVVRRVCVAAAVVWVLSTGIATTLGRISTEDAARVQRDVRGRLDVRPHGEAFEPLSWRTEDDQAVMRSAWTQPENYGHLLLSILAFGPSAVFLAAIATRSFARSDPATSRLLVVLTVGAVVSPFALHVFGSDLERWNGLVSLNAGLAGVMAMRLRREHDSALPSYRALIVACVVAAWGLSTDPPLFNGYSANHPPFARHVAFLMRAIRAPSQTIWFLPE